MAEKSLLDEEIVFDGTVTTAKSADLNRDGKVSKVEVLSRQLRSNVDIPDKSELGEVMGVAFPKENDSTTKMLGNIQPEEEPYILIFLMLDKLDVLPQEATMLALEKLLITPSRKARGRDDIIDISAGKTERDAKTGGKLGGFFGFGRSAVK